MMMIILITNSVPSSECLPAASSLQQAYNSVNLIQSFIHLLAVINNRWRIIKSVRI
jgi:hypothetical protein